jgi:predicted anti-sigma-YlaC factor YlaD
MSSLQLLQSRAAWVSCEQLGIMDVLGALSTASLHGYADVAVLSAAEVTYHMLQHKTYLRTP